MTMTTILAGLAVLTVLILLALKFGGAGKGGDNAESQQGPVIHMSGVYSILRESPRESLAGLRPGEEEMRRYLAGLDRDINGAPLDNAGRAALLKHWKVQTEVNLRAIETGDKNGIGFYYYDYPHICPVCAPFIKKGNFVTRKEIYGNPQIIPPFHLGCVCVLSAHGGSEEQMRETAKAGMLPFFEGEAPPPLPDWHSTVSISATAGDIK